MPLMKFFQTCDSEVENLKSSVIFYSDHALSPIKTQVVVFILRIALVYLPLQTTWFFLRTDFVFLTPHSDFMSDHCGRSGYIVQTCHSSRFNRDIPIFQYKSRHFPIPRVKIPSFCFVSKLEKQKGVSLCCMARVSKPTKFGLKINAMIGWILCTPRLSEWSRLGLASLSRHPELGLTWCHSSADPRNSAGFEGSSHLSSIPPIFPPFTKIWAAETGKVRSPK